MIRALVALLLVAALAGCSTTTGPPPSPATPSPLAPSASVVLHWMSWSRHSEPRNQLVFEGGGVGVFERLRLVAPDGVIVAEADSTPSAGTRHMCGPTKSDPSPTPFGALRATLTLANQEQLSAMIRQPNGYRVEVASSGVWRPVMLVMECSAQE